MGGDLGFVCVEVVAVTPFRMHLSGTMGRDEKWRFPPLLLPCPPCPHHRHLLWRLPRLALRHQESPALRTRRSTHRSPGLTQP